MTSRRAARSASDQVGGRSTTQVETAYGPVRARKVKSVCLRYRFSTPPAPGLSVSVAYVTPRHVIYKTVRTMWPGGAATTLTSQGLPARAYKHRRGTWFAVLRVDGAWIKTTALHVR